MNPLLRRGFTIIEMLIAVSILSTVLMIACQSLWSGSNLSGTMNVSMRSDDLAKGVVTDMVSDLRSGLANTTAQPKNIIIDASGITVKVCTSITGGVAAYNSTHAYAYNAVAGTLTKTVSTIGFADEVT